MTVLKEVVEELWKMFAGDWRLSLLVLLLVGAAALVAQFAHAQAAAGAVLFVGALAVLAFVVRHAAAAKARS